MDVKRLSVSINYKSVSVSPQLYANVSMGEVNVSVKRQSVSVKYKSAIVSLQLYVNVRIS